MAMLAVLALSDWTFVEAAPPEAATAAAAAGTGEGAGAAAVVKAKAGAGLRKGRPGKDSASAAAARAGVTRLKEDTPTVGQVMEEGQKEGGGEGETDPSNGKPADERGEEEKEDEEEEEEEGEVEEGEEEQEQEQEETREEAEEEEEDGGAPERPQNLENNSSRREETQRRQVVHHHGTQTSGYGGAMEGGSIGGGDGFGGESFTSRSAADETHGTNESAEGGVTTGGGGSNRGAGAAAVGGAISELRANDERGEGEVQLDVSERRGELGDCWITGPCVLCERDELLLEYCRDTGRRQEVMGGGGRQLGGRGGFCEAGSSSWVQGSQPWGLVSQDLFLVYSFV